MGWRFWESKASRIAREAARWRVEMEEPASQAQVDAFEMWLRADPAHHRAYGQFDSLAAAGQRLAPTGSTARVSAPRRLWPALGLAMTAVVAVLGFALFARPAEPQFATISNRSDAVRTVDILDGSVATLDTSSAIETAAAARRVRLLRGRVRLVIHPSVGESIAVNARSDTILANDCVLDLAMVDGGVRIRLVSGHAALARSKAPVPLVVGRPVSIREGVVTLASLAPDDGSWTLARVGFDNAPLEQILAAANSTGTPQISAADPAIAALRVTAVLDLRDTRKLARKLAAALDLRVIDRGDRLILAR